MHWLYVSASTLDGKSAQSTHVLEFCRALMRTHQVTLIAPIAHDFVVPAGITHIPVELPRYAKGLGFELHMLWYSLLHYSTTKPDIIYVRSGAFNFGSLLYARRHNIPCLLEVNGDLCAEYAIHHPAHTPSHYALLRTRLAIYKTSLQWSYRAATGIVTVTPGLRDIVVQEYGVAPERVLVAPNGVNIRTFIPLLPDVCRHRLGLSEQRRYVGFVGSLTNWQDVPTLLDGFALVADKHPYVDLLIVGDGPLRSSLERQIGNLNLEQRVHMIGAIPHDDIPLYLNACDIATVPKRFLSTGYSPLKIYEALGCGVTVLASAQPGLDFLVMEGVGCVFAPEDAGDLARQLDYMLCLPDGALFAMGLRARAVAEEYYAWDAVVDKVQHFATTLSMK